MEESDTDIVDDVLRGDRRRFAELVERHGRPLLGWIRSRLGDAETARDVFQETWLLALEGLGRLEDPGRLRSWLVGIAGNVLGKHHRRRGLSTVEAFDDEARAAAGPAVGEDLDRRESVGRVLEALRGLPARQREVFELRAIAGLEHAQIAARLDIREDASRANYYQAVRRLKATLGEEDR